MLMDRKLSDLSLQHAQEREWSRAGAIPPPIAAERALAETAR